jgi:hypothetical protein
LALLTILLPGIPSETSWVEFQPGASWRRCLLPPSSRQISNGLFPENKYPHHARVQVSNP